MTITSEIISTPGEILLEEYLQPLGISQYKLAHSIGKSESAISEIIHGKRAITPEMSYLLGQALGTSPEFWLNLEITYQIKTLDLDSLPRVASLV